ncbi:MAG: hypothetical protein KF861_07080 [Planctomycetaceae bacterium]|nr:hypothetical protein [Planctomycetaceae bacterium]
MSFSITVGSGGVPVGVYRARFVRVEHYQNDDRPDLPPGYKWIWIIVGGPHDGAEAVRITSTKFGPKAALPKLLKMLYWRDLKPGEQIDPESLYGVEGTIVIEETEGGGTRVGSFMRDPEANAAAVTF